VAHKHDAVALYHSAVALYQGVVAPHQGTYLQYSKSFDKLRMTKRNGNKKLGPAERRASVKACGQKHRSALSFASFWSSKRKKKKKSSALVVKKNLTKKK
jgi:hypothetical protein